MNNLESAEKKRKRLIALIALIIALNALLVFVFATNVDEQAGAVSEIAAEETVEDTVENTDTDETEEIIGNKEIATVVTGSNFTVALDSAGKVWSWGQNNKGQLGNGTLTDSSSKVAVILEPATQNSNEIIQLSNIKQVAAGEYHAVALTNDGKVYMWGYNYFGQIGSTTKRTELYPQLVDIPNGVSITKIACGADYTLMLTTEGKVLGIGDSSDGQLGYYNDLSFTSIREIDELKSETETKLPNIKEVVAGYNHIVALDNNGQVWTWGDTVGSGFEFTAINQVTFGEGEVIQELEAGNGVSMALTTAGNVYTWQVGQTPTKVDLTTVYGWDYSTETPTQTTLTLDTAVQVRTDSTKDNIAIVNKTFYFIDTNNKVFAWGQNITGQAGTGDKNQVSIPTELKVNTTIEINKEIDKVTSSAVSGVDVSGNTNYDTAYAINADGYVLGWGYAGEDIVETTYKEGTNTFKLLGDGTRSIADYIGSVSVKSIVGDDIILDITEQGIANAKDKMDLMKMLDEEGYMTGGRVNLYKNLVTNNLEVLEIKSVDEAIATFDNETGILAGVKQGRTTVEVKTPKNTIYLNVEVIGDDFTFAKMESGERFTVALKADGTVWAWGYSSYLGIIDANHDHTGIIVPTQVKGLEKIKDISVGEEFVIVLKADGTVWAWGYNGYGQLGDGTTTSTPNGSNNSIVNVTPKFVQVKRYEIDTETNEVVDYALENIVSISTGRYHGLALDKDGKVWGWGYNGHGQLGNGNTTSYETRAKQVNLSKIVDEEGNPEIIKQIESGSYTSYILTNTGNVYSFGYNGYYQCGMRGSYYIPTKVTTLNRIIEISANNYGSGSVFALTVGGKVWAFGYGYNYPTVLGLENVVDVEGIDGTYGAIVKLSDGTVGYWTGKSVNNNNLTMLKNTDGTENITDVMLISGGSSFYSVAKHDGSVWTSGTNSYGQLGNRTRNTMSLPNLKDISKEYIALNTNEITLKVDGTETITATHNYAFNLLKENEEIEMTYTSLDEEIAKVEENVITAVKPGTTYVIAEDENGTKLRVKVNVIAEVETAMPDVSVGYNHTVSLKTDGTVWGWGYNHYGELGATTGKIGEPTKLPVDTLIKDVAAGTYHTLMVTTDGKVLAMGYNGYGQLGNNTTSSSKVPVTVQVEDKDEEGNIVYKDLEGIVKVSAYYYMSLALDENGNVYAWGYNSNRYATKVDTYGLKVRDISERLLLTEDGRVLEYYSKTSLTYKEGLENIVEVSSSAYSTSSSYGYYMALNASGEVYTWVKSTSSYNRVSGNETTTPTKIEFAEGTNIVDIEAGVKVAYAKDENGDVYVWGSNPVYAATLGLGSSISSVATPTKINALQNAEILAASKYSNSYNRAFVSNETGSVYGFGYNGSYSLLGNSETTNYYDTPKLVGESYAGFVDENGNEKTRISMEKGSSLKIEAGLMDAFNLRSLTSATSNATTEFEWQVFNADLVGITDPETIETTKIITAKDIIGEATVVAVDKLTGKMAKLYIDVVEKDTLVAPKIESTYNHTVALKADGTVWVWGDNSYYQLGIRNQSVVKEPKQARIAKQITAIVPTLKLNDDGTTAVNEEGKEIYIDAKGNEYLQIGDNYTDLEGNLALKVDVDGRLYAWDAEENTFALEDILDANGNPVVVVDIATSTAHTLVLTKDGEVYSFGRNYYGQLGYSTYNNYGYIPAKVEGLKDIVKIVAGDTYSLALDKYGRLWGFGYLRLSRDSEYNSYSTLINSTTPNKIEKIRDVDITTLMRNAIDITNECVLTKDGKVISLKLNTSIPNVGTEITGITGKVIKITRRSGYASTYGSTSNGHTALLTENGTVYTIGYGTKGQLGNESETNSLTQAVQVLNVDMNALDNIRDVYVGENHTMAISKDGKIYTWGDNTYGQLRSSVVEVGVNIARAYETAADDRIKDAILVSGGNGFTVVVDKTGYAYAWGQGTSSQLGNKLGVNSIEAVAVGTEGVTLDKNHVTLQEKGNDAVINGKTNLLNLIYDQNITINSVSSNDATVATVSKVDSDTVKLNPANQGTTSVVVESAGATGKQFKNIIQVTVLPKVAELAEDVEIPAGKIIQPMTVSGESHTLILKSDGTVWAYGDNTYGQTAAKDANGKIIKYTDKVTKVEFPEGTGSIIAVAAGDSFSVALDVNGNVYAWGYNRYGQLGQGSYDSSIHAVPTKVNGVNGIIKVVAGSNQVIALDKEGYAYSWGRNISGSLGIGSTSDSYSPIRITNVASVIDIAAAKEHAMLLTSAGEVYTTGRNSVGQLGIEGVPNRVVFEKVKISEKIAYIEAGDRASLAIDINGKVWAWGNNEYGQLGLGVDDKIVYIPTQVTSISDRIASASVGENHTHVVTTNGKLYVAGSNNYGQLGIGESTENTNVYAQVTKLGTTVMNSDAGTTYSTAIDKDGTVFGFGDYNHGDIDRISLTDSDYPVMISDNTSYLDEQEIVINVGETYTLNTNGRYKLNVLHKDNSVFTFESTATDIATVDEKGIITGAAVGTTTVKAKDEIGKVNTVIVKVIPENAVQAPVIDGGDKFATVTNSNGTVYLFGNKENVTDANIPTIINDSLSFVSTKAGDDFVVAINNDRTVWAWGDNTYGQLGVEELPSSEKVIRLNRNYIKDIAQIDAGSKHAIALDKLGTVYVWGDNSNGQLGIAVSEETKVINTPTVIRPVSGRIISVSAGGNYSAIVNTKGEVYLLKNGSAYKVSGIEGAVKVATGVEDTLVLTNDGKVYVVDNELLFATPKTINEQVVDIAANKDTFMCLTSDKKLYTFGNNEYGQLGVNTTEQSNGTPREVAQDVYTMGVGNNNTYYINTQGEVLAAGLNTSGELGNGTSGNNKTATSQLSRTYVKVGDTGFELEPEKVRVSTDWTILVGSEELTASDNKTKIALIEKDNEFNVFGNKITDLDEYTFEITDTSKAEITEPETLKIVTKELGTTTLKVTNKVSNEKEELKIFIIEEDLLRIENIYVDDTATIFNSDVDEENKFLINIEGSKDSGTLNIELTYDDTLKVFDGETELTVVKDANTNNWKISGMDLTKSVQELTLQLTTADKSKTYEFTVIIYKEAVVKVNEEILSAVEEVNKETSKVEKVYTKYINPADEKANVEIYINNIENGIQLEDLDGNTIKTVAPNTILEAEVEVPNVKNRFIIKTINPQNATDKVYVLEILKSSIEEITVIDTEEDPTNVIADRIAGTEYIEEFSADVNDVNNPVNAIINLGNSNIVSVKVDGVDQTASISNSKLAISKALNSEETQTTDVEIEIVAKDVITNVEYTEKHILRIKSISSNNNIESIRLTAINREEITEITSRVAPDEDFAYEIVLHDAEINLNNVSLSLITDTESKKAQVSYNGGIEYKESGKPRLVYSKQVTENKYEVKLIVKAENGDTQEYKLYIYKESENAKLDKINVTGVPSNKPKVAIKENGTNNYIGKVLKNQESYVIEVICVDSYSEIDFASIKVEGVDDASTLLTQTSGANGKYVYSANKDILGKTITLVVTPEYDKAPTETFTLVLEEMDDNPEFGFIKVDETIFTDMEVTEFTKDIKALDKGELTVKAESDTAKVEIYLANPTTDANAKAIAKATGNITMDIPFNGERTRTLYIKVTSEDETKNVVKTLIVTRKSNIADITNITATSGETVVTAKVDETDSSLYVLNISETITTPVINVQTADPYAKVLIDEQKDLNNTAIDISEKDNLKITVISEDETVTKEYTLKINKLSPDLSFTKQLQSPNGTVIKDDSDFKVSGTNYTAKVARNAGNLVLVVTPGNSNAKVRMAIIKNGSVDVPQGERVYVENKLELPTVDGSVLRRDIEVILTAEDGRTAAYTITVSTKDQILSSASVSGTNSEVIALTDEQIKNLEAEVRVHPDTDVATVKLVTAYYPVEVVATIIHPGMVDADGNPIEEVVETKQITNTSGTTVTVKLLDDIKDVAEVAIKMTTSDGEEEVLLLSITRGSTDPILEKVELTGITTQDEYVSSYTNPTRFENKLVVDSEDNMFDMNISCIGTYQVYKLSEDAKWQEVDLSSQENITENLQIELTEEDQEFVIVVTSEYGGNTQNYHFVTRKLSSNTELDNLSINVKAANGVEATKKLTDFAGFERDTNSNMMTTTVLVPSSVNELSLYDLVLENENATAEWTDIITSAQNKVYTKYNDGDTKLLTNISAIDLKGLRTKTIYIKVIAESGDIENYAITIRKVNDNVSLGEFSLYNVTDEKQEKVENNKAQILETVKEIIVTGNPGMGAVKLKVKEINGHEINENITTSPEFVLDSNKLTIALDTHYTYTDTDGVVQTIPSAAIRTIVVERTLHSEGYYLYPEYYEENVSDYVLTDTLTITRLMSDSSVVVKYLDNGVEKTIETDDFEEATLVDNELVREITVYLPSTQEDITITNIKSNNEYAKVFHGQTSAIGENGLYTVDNPYTRAIPSEDKGKVTEIIKVEPEIAIANMTYKVTFVKCSENTDIETVTLNGFETNREENTDVFNDVLLAPANKVEIGVTEVEENATVKVYISSINDTAITTSEADKVVTYQETVNGKKDVIKDLSNLLTNALRNNSISRSDLNNVTVKIEVQAQDSNIEARVYTLNITVEASSLISINGLDVEGNISESAQILAEDFVKGYNPFYTEEIVIPAGVTSVELTDILCQEDAKVKVYDVNGNELVDRKLTVDLSNGAETAIIKVELDGKEQQYNIVIRNKLTDTSIKSVKADENTTDILDGTENAYVIDVRSTVNPEVTVVLNDSNAKVISAMVNGTSYEVVDNKFTITGIAVTTHDDSQEEEPIIVKVKVQAEDEATEPAEHTIKLVRKHVETGLEKVAYEYNGSQEIELDYTQTEQQQVQIIPSSVEGIRITLANTVCENAKAYVKLEDGTLEEIDETKLYEIAEEETKTFTIVVRAEYGNEKQYTFKVKRISSNTKLTDVNVVVDNETIEAVYDEENKIYTADITVIDDPEIVITPESSYTKITGTPIVYNVVNGELSNVTVAGATSTSFGILGLSDLYENDETEDNSEENRFIMVEFTVIAEDPAVTETYKLKLTRRHIETSLADISYSYNETVEAEDGTTSTEEKNGTLTLDSQELKEIFVEKTVEKVNIAKIVPNCDKATVKITVDGIEAQQTEDGFTVDLTEAVTGDGCIRNVVVTVIAESGDTEKYKFDVIRMATNASLSKVYVKGVEAVREELTEEGYAAIFRANVLDTDTIAAIQAISANRFAVVSITNDKYTTDGNNSYNETGKYDLSDAIENNTREVALDIVVRPQSEEGETKTYKLIITRLYTDPVIQEMSIKPAVDGITDEPIKLKDTADSTDFTKEAHPYYVVYRVGNNWHSYLARTDYWYQTERIYIPTEWTEISIGDILPEDVLDVQVARIANADPYPNTSIIEKYDVDTAFTMPEGEDIYIKVVSKAESGATKVYVINLYKKSTNTDISSLRVNGTVIEKDETDNIYKTIINVDTEPIRIVLNTQNNILLDETNIKSITANGTDITSLVGISKTGSVKQASFTLGDILNNLDDVEHKVLTIQIELQAEDENIEPATYTVQITRIHTSADIKQILGNDENVAIDNQITHYQYVGKPQIDNTIYTQYINENVTEVTTDIIAESAYAKIYVNNEYKGIGIVEDYIVEIQDSLTQVELKLESEDGLTTKNYQLWFIKKSNDATIGELKVDGNILQPNEDGNYEYTISDTTKNIKVEMTPNYQFANVSINGQIFKWQYAKEIIENINNYRLVDGKVRIELRVQIPAEQSETGQVISKVQYLLVQRVSTSNAIASITTDNDSDNITPGDSPQNGYHNDKYTYRDTYKVLLEATAEEREEIDLRIEPLSPMATVELYDLDGNKLDYSVGTLYYQALPVANDEITVVKVKVIPQMGSAKEYFIDITPKAINAELEYLEIGGEEVPLQVGVYEYKVDDFNLTGIGTVYARAEYNKNNSQYGVSKVNIYTLNNENGTGEQDGEATLTNVEFDKITYVTIAVTAPNGKNINTYTLWLKDVSDDRSLQEVSYLDGENKVIVNSIESTDSNYAGEYLIELEPEKQDIDITIIANDPLSKVELEEADAIQILNVSKDLTEMTEDFVADIIVTAESGNKSKYKLTIKKNTIITGKIETENVNKDYAGVDVKVLDSQDQEVATGLTEADGTFNIKVPAGDNYKVVIAKEGYLTHTVINIPATYGIRRYVGFAELIAGEVATNDEYIELRDLVQVRKKARVNTVVDSSNEKYDFNEDGIINNTDLDIVIKNYDKKAKVVEYIRTVNIIGEVLDNNNTRVTNATIEMVASAITSETGEFNLGDIGLGEYTLIVKDSNGTVIGSDPITIVEGTEYTIENNVITVTPNTGIVDLTVRVNGTRAIISKRGEESNSDITNPVNVTLNAEVVDNGIKLTATADDTNLSKFTFYSVAKDGTRTEILVETITGVTTATVEKVYVKATQFNEIYKFELDVEDLFGNKTTASVEIIDNTIKTVDELVAFSELVNNSDSSKRKDYEGETVTLVANLDLADLEEGKTFMPIGGGSMVNVFKGTFDGKGHTISNMNIKSEKNRTGLFGNISGATIKNIGIESGDITSTSGYAGGIVGYADKSLIENCYNKANINASGSYVGGIVGYAKGSTQIVNCYNTGNISGEDTVGGIAGTINETETIQNCYNIGTITGTITGTKYIGEIVGTIRKVQNATELGSFENCYYLETNNNDPIGETTSERIYVAEPITDTTTLLSELGDAFKADFETPINNGYPILAWEEDIQTMALMLFRESEVTLPISGEYTITSEFGTRIDPITGEEGDKHYGMDIASNYQDPILAIANGTVTFAGSNGGYGYCVEIEHVINGETVYSFYAHLNRIDVKVGDKVVKGEQIGLEGGLPGEPGAGTSTGVHLHLEIRKISGSYSSAVDPRNYLEF